MELVFIKENTSKKLLFRIDKTWATSCPVKPLLRRLTKVKSMVKAVTP